MQPSSEDVKISDRLIKSAFVTYKTICVYRKAKLKDLLKELHIGRTQLYKHLRLLERAELVKRFRMDGYTYVVVARFVDREKFREKIIDALRKKTVYDIADRIRAEIEEYDIPADLFGTCKIHGEVEMHNRITEDINIVVTRESYKYLHLVLEKMGYHHPHRSQLLWADYFYNVPDPRITIYVTIDGVKHPVRKEERFYNLAPVLRAKRKLDLEHAVAGKLMRFPSIRKKADGYDIAVSLAHGVNLDKLVDIIQSVLDKYPDLKEIVVKNINEVETYLKYYGDFDGPSIEKIRYSLGYIESKLELRKTASKRL